MIVKSVANWLGKSSWPRWALVVTALVQLVLCADYHQQRWDTVLVNYPLPPERGGEGLVIQWNGLGYYAWLRSLLIDHDWDFDNEFDEHNPHHYYVPPPSYRTPLDRRANQWSVGPACLWAITVVPCHFILKASGGSLGPWAADGYSLPYQLLVGGTSLLLAFAGLGFLYGICRTQARPARAALAATLLTLGTAIAYYNAFEISLPHGLGTAALAGAVWYWLTTYGSLRPRRWLIVGVWLGAAALVRWQLATFLILPAGEALLAWRHREGGRRECSWRHSTMLGVLAVGGAVVAFLPQLLAWRLVYGSWFVNPIQGVHYHWLTPSLWTILCSQDRSLFYWTPLTLLACVGALACLRQTKPSAETSTDTPSNSPKEPLWILCAAFGIQVYALAGMWGQGEPLSSTGNFAGVFLARSYGFRDLTESLIVLAPGLAWLLERTSGWRFRWLTGISFALVFWNLLMVLQYSYDLLPPNAGLAPRDLAISTWRFIENESLTCLLLAEALGLFWLLLVWGQETPTSHANRKEESPSPSLPSLSLSVMPQTKIIHVLSALALLVSFLGYFVLSEKNTGFVPRIHRDKDGRAWKYTLFIPTEYNNQPYPLLVYLHGYGARGVDGDKPTTDGPGAFLRERGKTFDMLVLFPQSESGSWEADTEDGQRVMAILEEVMRDYAVDRRRIYLTGTSAGGFGVWSLAARYPHKWAAIVPICGGGDPASVEAIQHIPCWCFHGACDKVIDVGQSRNMIAALRAVGARPRYTEYPDVGHACWDRAYSTAELWHWLRRQCSGPIPSMSTTRGQRHDTGTSVSLSLRGGSPSGDPCVAVAVRHPLSFRHTQ
jgi:poly(3-hydroxybutyrate) depolymerase